MGHAFAQVVLIGPQRLGDRHRKQFVFRVAEHLDDGGVGFEVAAVFIDHQHAVQRLLDVRAQLAFAVAQCLLGRLALGDVANDAAEVALFSDAHFAHPQLQRHPGAVLAQPGHRAADADDLGGVSVEVVGKVAVVLLVVGRGHQHVEVAADHLVGLPAENPFGGGVVALHDAVRVDREDGVQRMIEHREKACLALLALAECLAQRGGALIHEPQRENAQSVEPAHQSREEQTDRGSGGEQRQGRIGAGLGHESRQRHEVQVPAPLPPFEFDVTLQRRLEAACQLFLQLRTSENRQIAVTHLQADQRGIGAQRPAHGGQRGKGFDQVAQQGGFAFWRGRGRLAVGVNRDQQAPHLIGLG